MAPLPGYFKLCASSRSHWWIQTGVTAQRHPIGVKFDDFKSCVTLKFDVWPCKTIGYLFYATSSFLHSFVAIGQFQLELKSGNAQSVSNLMILLAVWPWNFTDDLEKNNRVPLLSNIKLYASFHRNIWIQTGVKVRKWLNGVMTSVTLTFDLWLWPFAWTSLLLLVIPPENFMMMRWWEHSQKGVTDRRTDRLNHSKSCLVAAKNKRAPLLCYFKLCAAFHSHWWIQTGVTVRKRPIWVKFDDF